MNAMHLTASPVARRVELRGENRNGGPRMLHSGSALRGALRNLLVCLVAGWPSSARPDGEISEFKIGRDGDVPAIQVTTLGRQLRFVVESGAPTTVIDAKWRGELRRRGLLPPVLEEGRAPEIDSADGPPMQIGDFRATPSSVIVADLARLGPLMVRDLDGYLGLDVLSPFVVTIDSAGGVLQLRLTVPADPGESFPLIEHPQLLRPAVQMAIGAAPPAPFLICTAGTAGLIVPPSSFADLHAAGAVTVADPTITRFDIERRSVSGIATTAVLGPFVCRDVEIDTFQAHGMGMGYLSRYVVTIDFPRKRVYFKKGRDFGRRDHLNRSGAFVGLEKGQIVAKKVRPHTPADAAGLLEDDRIVQIGGRAVAEYSIREIANLFTELSDDLVLLVARGRRTREIVIRRSSHKGTGPAYTGSRSVREPTAGGSHDLLAEFDVEKYGAPLIVPVSVAGFDRELPMIMDTGSSVTTFDVRLRSHFRNTVGEMTLDTPFGDKRLARARTGNVALGGIALSDESIAMLDDLEVYREGTGCDVEGLLGIDVLKRLVLQIDFDVGKCRVLSGVGPDAGERIDFVYGQTGPPAVKARIGGRPGDWFVVDTGFAIGGSTCNPPLFSELRQAGEISRVHAARSPHNPNWVGQFGIAHRVELGPFSHQQIGVVGSNSTALGLPYLSRFVVTFDFPGRALYLKKGASYGLPERQDRSGARIAWRGGKYVVASLMPNGPAEQAGVREGDVVVGANGQKVPELSLSQLRELLKSDGPVELSLRRGTATKRLNLKLRDYLAELADEETARGSNASTETGKK